MSGLWEAVAAVAAALAVLGGFLAWWLRVTIRAEMSEQMERLRTVFVDRGLFDRLEGEVQRLRRDFGVKTDTIEANLAELRHSLDALHAFCNARHNRDGVLR